MNHPNSIVSNQKEESIGSQRVKKGAGYCECLFIRIKGAPDQVFVVEDYYLTILGSF